MFSSPLPLLHVPLSIFEGANVGDDGSYRALPDAQGKSWDADSQEIPTFNPNERDGKATSISVLLQHLGDADWMDKCRAGSQTGAATTKKKGSAVNQGKTKQQHHLEIAEKIECVVGVCRNSKSVASKINSVIKSFKEAQEVPHGTGSPLSFVHMCDYFCHNLGSGIL
jgi:hypothetical protein